MKLMLLADAQTYALSGAITVDVMKKKKKTKKHEANNELAHYLF